MAFMIAWPDRPNSSPRLAVAQSWEAFGEARPASTLVEIAALAIPGAKIEVEAVAVVP
jgi:enamine deaminase RidA (YjgF/YER057c/UK114 family)